MLEAMIGALGIATTGIAGILLGHYLGKRSTRDANLLTVNMAHLDAVEQTLSWLMAGYHVLRIIRRSKEERGAIQSALADASLPNEFSQLEKRVEAWESWMTEYDPYDDWSATLKGVAALHAVPGTAALTSAIRAAMDSFKEEDEAAMLSSLGDANVQLAKLRTQLNQ